MCDDRKRETQANDTHDFANPISQGSVRNAYKRAEQGRAIPNQNSVGAGIAGPNETYGAGSFSVGNAAGVGSDQFAGSHQPADKLSPSSPRYRSLESINREQSLRERLHYKLESRESINREITDLRRLIQLSQMVDIDAISEYLGLIQKYGL